MIVTTTWQTLDGIRFEVIDTGMGIDAASRDRMFEPFVQADVSMTRKYGGNGLGLAISKELVERMGGTIGAESEPGRGSTFWFALELPQATEAPAVREPQELPVPRSHSSIAPLILVAEDNPVNRDITVRVLERCGCDAHAVQDGREALEALATRDYDAVLIDCQLPVLDGYEVTRELRRREQGVRHTPVIAMTARAMSGDRERCLAAGMDDYLTKPLRAHALTETLARWVTPTPPGEPPVAGHEPPQAIV